MADRISWAKTTNVAPNTTGTLAKMILTHRESQSGFEVRGSGTEGDRRGVAMRTKCTDGIWR
ncbi:MAG: hypothetical protein IPN71_08565 [Fibrobacteres bacterium]|nr:hypothetical protein [Fibrobacterota bacterium]